MFKKYLYISLKTLGLLVFFILMFFLGIMETYFSNQLYLYYLILVASSALLLPLLYKYYPGRKLKKLGLHVGFITGALLLLEVSKSLMLQNRGIHQFSYQLGNIAGPFRILVQNGPAQYVLKKSVSILPYTIQYVIFAYEDLKRATEIKALLEDANEVKRLCPIIDKYECFKEIFISANTNAPFTVIGNIIIAAYGTLAVQGEDYINETSRFKIGVRLRTSEISKFISESLTNKAMIENILPSFPKNEVASLPHEIATELDNYAKNFDGDWKFFIFGFDKRTKSNYDKEIFDAYILMMVDKVMLKKFQDSTTETRRDLKSDLIKKIENNKFRKDLTKEEILDFERRIKTL